MSQTNYDPNDYEQEPTPKKSATGKAAKHVGEKVAKKAAKAAAAKAGISIGWPVILGVAAVGIIAVGLAVSLVMIVASTSTSEETSYEGGLGFWGGEISEIGANEIPAAFIPIYKAAEEEYGVPWNLIAAHHRVETVFSTIDPMVSPVGAEGHMQFMPCTWTGWNHPTCGGLGAGNIPDGEKMDPAVIARYGGYGVDANGDGKADPWDIEDAIYSAANYLAASGAADGRIRDAIFAYNRADWYVEEVLGFADSYVEGYVAIGGGTGGNTGVEVVDVGNQWIGNSVYVFGGGRNQADIAAGRFDCSSFVHWAFAQVGMDLGPLTSTSTETLKHLGQPVSPNDMQPGDLVFFDTYKIDGHVGIYVGDGKFIGAQTNTGVAIADLSQGYWLQHFNGRVKRL
ncbi:bifunctional lytic transglycosylase/C40 family peptidase [Jeotgalibacillus proteolyticus]|uniref:Secreted cell wall DL-endopeptidase n=1 Tax=Jeotgalibacillus proteolyticus TaxID=2082395 RepID=A0A2S5G721_9BACL|nr:bifunctional lytic transglycosylase/C40 family peptidase [Jeotgalibacillus proteolyticus]PPA68693.1 secreted cell wall DL-endopeptidase [Jeotgalibacillus proteolyticus]PPA68770.1 secreted cell wall DL-endopeptidase [Jeotgalibacillus proteolyticus]